MVYEAPSNLQGVDLAPPPQPRPPPPQPRLFPGFWGFAVGDMFRIWEEDLHWPNEPNQDPLEWLEND